MEIKSPSIINFDEGVFLNTKIINSISVREIQVDHTGNMAWAIVCYPNAGAGFVVCKCNEKESAMQKFSMLLSLAENEDSSVLMTNDFVQPEPKEAEQLQIEWPTTTEETATEETSTEEKGE